MYDAGELSRMMVLAIGRPSCDRSCTVRESQMTAECLFDGSTYLNIVSTVIVTALSEQSMCDGMVWVESV